MASLRTQTFEETCPNCGELANLTEKYGWCAECSRIFVVNSPVHGRGKSTAAQLIAARTLVSNEIEIYLERHADEIEALIAQGNSFTQALKSLKKSQAPTCLSCAAVVARGPRNMMFCRGCARYSRRYTYLYREKGFTKPEALAKVLSEL